MGGEQQRQGWSTRRRMRADDRRSVWRRGRIRRGAAAVCAGVAVWIAVGAMRPDPPPTQVVVVAAGEIPLGTVLDPGSISAAAVPSDAVPAGALTSVEEALGRRTVGAVRPGEVITDARIASSSPPDEQFGVMFVPVADSAVVTAVRPGDRIDLLAADGTRVVASALVTGVAPEASPPGLFVAVDAGPAAALAQQVHPMAPGVTVVIREVG